MDLKSLSTLKQKVISAKDLSGPWTYFFDNFGENPAFLELGFPSKNELLEIIIAEIGKQVFNQNATITNLILTEIPEYYFIHGACSIEGKLANILLFTDIDKGLLTVVKSLRTGEVCNIRFSTAVIGEG